jgi:hypothetical protein
MTTGGTHVPLGRRWQYVLLVLVVAHLLAVFSEPFHFFTRSPVQTGADADFMRGMVSPYTQWMYLDHGYFFFAPNPGVGRLLRVSATDEPVVRPSDLNSVDPYQGILYPNRNEQWPRLLYHRYFMFSEFYHTRFAPFELVPELKNNPIVRSQWDVDRKIYRAIQNSIIENAKQSTGKQYVRLDRIERLFPDRESTLSKGVRLTDPRWLRILPEGDSLAPLPGQLP